MTVTAQPLAGDSGDSADRRVAAASEVRSSAGASANLQLPTLCTTLQSAAPSLRVSLLELSYVLGMLRVL